MDVLDFLRPVPAIAETIARDLPITGQQLLLGIGGFFVLLILLILLILLKRLRQRGGSKGSKHVEEANTLLARQLEELALEAEALEELYNKGYISSQLFLEEASGLKKYSEVLEQYLQRRQ